MIKSLKAICRERTKRRSHTGGRFTRRLAVEQLEQRLPLDASSCLAPACLEIPLIPEFDQFGSQIQTVQAYQDATETRASFAIYDTGASVITFSAADQMLYDMLGAPIPIKVPGGAEASAIGGTLVGDVSEPGRILADGLHAITIDGLFDIGIDLSQAAVVEGNQAFVGTTDGSPILPTITGVPIHNPSPSQPDGVAARIDMAAYALDFGELFPEFPEFADIVVFMPDLHFVPPGSQLEPRSDGSTTDPVRIPLSLWGVDNHLNPGDMITASPVPVQTGTRLQQGELEVGEQTMLLDTGAQLSVISTDIALGLGLDLNAPQTTLTVQGAAGTTDVPGFTIDLLELHRDTNGDGAADGTLRFTDVPIYVLDIVEGLDGILGMNLFNTADAMLYDPFDPAGSSLSVTFFTDMERIDFDLDELAGEMLIEAFPAFAGVVAGHNLPDFHFEIEGGWQNPLNPLDVNNSGIIAPLDALLIINDLNRHGIRELPHPPLWPDGRPTYLDVDGDGRLTPMDALLVINFLNRQTAGGPADNGDSDSGVNGANNGEGEAFAQLAGWQLSGGETSPQVETDERQPQVNVAAIAWKDFHPVDDLLPPLGPRVAADLDGDSPLSLEGETDSLLLEEAIALMAEEL